MSNKGDRTNNTPLPKLWAIMCGHFLSNAVDLVQVSISGPCNQLLGITYATSLPSMNSLASNLTLSLAFLYAFVNRLTAGGFQE
jgi:hypothetical protein